jgi:hypothetical protein
MFNDDYQSEEADDELFDNEYSDEDESDDDATATLICPHCGAEVYEDAEYCPVCDNFISPRANAISNRPLWWILLGLAGVVATLAVLVGFLSW